MGRIVILNGISSSGKTSVAKALQDGSRQLFLCIGTDDFYGLLPNWFRHSRSERWPAVNLHLQEALFKTAKILADQGYDVIVDTVLIDLHDLRQCAQTLRQREVMVVALICPLEEVQRRERERGDRVIGMASQQHPLIHQHDIYDLEIDTSQCTPEACAIMIHDMLNSGQTFNDVLGRLPDDLR